MTVKVNTAVMLGEIISKLPSANGRDKMLKALGAAARAEWISLASDKLTSTSRDYIQGIGEPEIKGNMVSVKLTGVLPNMVEQGWPMHDLRQTVLRSSKAKTSKAGHKYMSIPFRHGGPGSGGRNVGRPMPKPIHNVARRLQASHAPTDAGHKRLSLNMRMGIGARKILESKAKTWHSTSIYTGMIRKVSTYSTQKGKTVQQSSYQTFRTISENTSSGPQHWIHPGIKARNLVSKVQNTIRDISSKIIADASK